MDRDHGVSVAPLQLHLQGKRRRLGAPIALPHHARPRRQQRRQRHLQLAPQHTRVSVGRIDEDQIVCLPALACVAQGTAPPLRGGPPPAPAPGPAPRGSPAGPPARGGRARPAPPSPRPARAPRSRARRCPRTGPAPPPPRSLRAPRTAPPAPARPSAASPAPSARAAAGRRTCPRSHAPPDHRAQLASVRRPFATCESAERGPLLHRHSTLTPGSARAPPRRARARALRPAARARGP